MGDVSEVQQAKKWIYDSLHGNSEIAAVVGTRIFSAIADPYNPASFPYILFTFLAGVDTDGLGTNRIFSRPLFQVIVVTNAFPDATIRKVDKRIDDVLRIAVTQPSGEFYFTARREQPVDRVFTDANRNQFFSLGGLFRLWIGKTV